MNNTQSLRSKRKLKRHKYVTNPFSLCTSFTACMETLPEILVFEILSRVDDSAAVACCRAAWKTFNTLSPGLHSINLQWPLSGCIESRSRVSNASSSSQITSPLKTIFLNLLSNLTVVESVRIGVKNQPRDLLHVDVEDKANDLHLTDWDFIMEWLPRVSGSLKTLSISDFWAQSFHRRSNVLFLVSAYCKFFICWIFFSSYSIVTLLRYCEVHPFK